MTRKWSYINTLSVTGKSVQRCPEAQHCRRHSTRSQEVPVDISRNNQLCHHWPLHHHYHHIPKLPVGKQCQVTVGPVTLSCNCLYQGLPGNSRLFRSLLQLFILTSARYQWPYASWWSIFLCESWIIQMPLISYNSTKYHHSTYNGETAGDNANNIWCPILTLYWNLIPLKCC